MDFPQSPTGLEAGVSPSTLDKHPTSSDSNRSSSPSSEASQDVDFTIYGSESLDGAALPGGTCVFLPMFPADVPATGSGETGGSFRAPHLSGNCFLLALI